VAIDRLSTTSALIATLRAGVERAAGQAPKATGAGLPAGHSALPKTRPQVGELRLQLVDLVRGEDIDDPAAVKRLRPRLVRAILLWEFGPSLREHPEWQAILESICSTLESSSGQAKHFSALLADLRTPSDP
jgi:hypothetical protein